jgi:hypothetical protein
MTSQPASRLSFVNIDNGKDPSIWWPCLIYQRFQDLINDIPTQTRKAQAILYRVQLRGKFSQETSWALLLGKVRPTISFITLIQHDHFENDVKDFYSHVEDMENLYMTNDNWKVAEEEAISILQHWVDKSTSSNMDFTYPSGDTFKLFGGVSNSEFELNANDDNSLMNVPQESNQDDIESSADAQMNDMDDNQNELKKKRKKGNDSDKLKKLPSKDIDSGSTLSSSSSFKKKKTSIDSKKSSMTTAELPQKTSHDNTPRRSSRLNNDEVKMSKSNAVKQKINQNPSKVMKESKTKESDGTPNKKTVRSSPRLSNSKENGTVGLKQDKAETKSFKSKSTSVNMEKDEESDKTERRSSPRLRNQDEVNSPESVSLTKTKIRKKDNDESPKEKLTRHSPRLHTPQSSSVNNKTDTKLSSDKESGNPNNTKDSIYSKKSNRENNKSQKQSSSITPTHTGRLTSPAPTVTPGKVDYNKSKKRNQSVPSNLMKNESIKERDEWSHVMNILKSRGYFLVSARNKLIDYYFVKGEFRGLESEEALQERGLKENKDYFCGEDKLKAYIHNKYGWIGPKGKEYQPLGRRRSSQTSKKASTNSKIKHLDSSKNVVTGQKRSRQGKNSGNNAKSGNDGSQVVTKDISDKADGNTHKRRRTNTLTVKDRLNQCINHLDVSNVSEEILFFGDEPSSKLSSKQDSIMKFLERSYSDNDRESSIMYICGNPGMGKVCIY